MAGRCSACAFFLVALEIANADLQTGFTWAVVSNMATQIGWGLTGGLVAGILGGLLFRFADRRSWISGEWRQIVLLAVALLAYTIALTLVRMIPVAIAFAGQGVKRPTVAFIGWFGPRGLASLVFALLALERGVPEGELVLTTVVVTVAVILHGLTSVPLLPPTSAGTKGTRPSIRRWLRRRRRRCPAADVNSPMPVRPRPVARERPADAAVTRQPTCHNRFSAFRAVAQASGSSEP